MEDQKKFINSIKYKENKRLKEYLDNIKSDFI